MWKNHFKIALRNLLKHKGAGFINIIGLSIGTAVVMLLSLYVWSEGVLNCLQFNAAHTDQSLEPPISMRSLLLLPMLALITGFLSGIYPALVLSGFKPAMTLRGILSDSGNDRHTVLRRLVGLQFILSVLLITGTVVMLRQMNSLQNKNLGYDKQQVMAQACNRSGARLSEQWEGRPIGEG